MFSICVKNYELKIMSRQTMKNKTCETLHNVYFISPHLRSLECGQVVEKSTKLWMHHRLEYTVLTRQEYRKMGDNQRLTEWMGGWMDGWIKIKL